MTLKRVGTWTLTAALAAMFAMAGSAKLAAAPALVANFARWGYPSWFLPLTGGIELAAAALLLWPRTAFWGAALLVSTMVGAVATHLAFAEWGAVPLPLALLVASAVVAFVRRPDFLRSPLPAAAARA